MYASLHSTDDIDRNFVAGNTDGELGGGLPGTSNNMINVIEDFDDELLSADLSSEANNPVEQAKLQLNGHDRFAEREGSYFNFVQPYQHHTNIPSVGINVYSFGLKPEEHQPSGTCNMSRIDNVSLNLNLTKNTFILNTKAEQGDDDFGKKVSAKVKVFATNYNVLRIMSGMGGLAYSN